MTADPALSHFANSPILLGAAISLIASISGVLIANWLTGKRAKKEREMITRKEIFLEGAQAINIGLRSIHNYSNSSIPDASLLNDYLDAQKAFSKVHLIASLDTIVALTEFTKEIQATFYQLALKRPRMMISYSKTQLLQQQIDFCTAGYNEHIRLMDEAAGTKEGRIAERMDALNQQLIHAQSLMPGAQRELKKNQIEMLRAIANELSRLSPFWARLVINARKELEISIDAEFYSGLIKQADNAAREQFDSFIAHLQP